MKRKDLALKPAVEVFPPKRKNEPFKTRDPLWTRRGADFEAIVEDEESGMVHRVDPTSWHPNLGMD